MTEEKVNEMMKEWMSNGQEMQEMDRMMKAWGDVWQDDYELKVAKDPKVI